MSDLKKMKSVLEDVGYWLNVAKRNRELYVPLGEREAAEMEADPTPHSVLAASYTAIEEADAAMKYFLAAFDPQFRCDEQAGRTLENRSRNFNAVVHWLAVADTNAAAKGKLQDEARQETFSAAHTDALQQAMSSARAFLRGGVMQGF